MATYTLLALSGLAPQVVTEAAWSLARQHHPPLVPERVEVVATGAGEAVGRALLLGEAARDPVTGQPSRPHGPTAGPRSARRRSATPCPFASTSPRRTASRSPT